MFIVSNFYIVSSNIMEIIKKIWNRIRRIFKKDEVFTFIVTNKEGEDELWVYKNGKRIK